MTPSRPQPPYSPYSIELRDRGEEVVYTAGALEVFLSRTYGEGQRLFLSDTQLDSEDAALAVAVRLRLTDHLCDHFGGAAGTRAGTLTLVLDEADSHRAELEARIDARIADGQQLQIEWDSEVLRAARVDEMYLGIIASQSALSIDGVELDSAESYWRWKSGHTRAG